MNITKHFLTALFLLCLVVHSIAGINMWTQCAGTNGYAIQALLLDTTTTGRIYAGTDGLLISSDYGTTWIFSNVTSVTPYPGVVAIAVNPKSPNEVYIWLGDGGGIGKNTTYGFGNWTSITNDLSDACAVPELLIDPENVGRMYVGACLSGNTFIYRSDDTGYNWTSSYTGITTDQGTGILTMHPTIHNRLYAGAPASPGIFESDDGATTWHSLSLYNAVNSLAFDPTDSNKIYAGGSFGVFASSFDGGTTWNISSDSTFANEQINAVVVNPLNPMIIYVGVDSNGIFKSKDRGNTWSAMSTGLQTIRIYSLAYDTVTRTLFAAGSIFNYGVDIPGVYMYQDTDLDLGVEDWMKY